MEKEIKYIDLIELFLTYTIYDIKKEVETPNINFIFNEEGINFFRSIINDGEFRMHHAHKNDLNYLLKHSSDNCISLCINDTESFFKYLMEIVTATLKLMREYEDNPIAYENARYILRRIWLRLGVEDVLDINRFLQKQLEFVRNRTFDTKEPVFVGKLDKYDITMKTRISDSWDESTRHMVFNISDGTEEYELPHILYDIDEEGVCHLYAIQSHDTDKSKHIERKLYKINKGIENPNVHPSKVFALVLFIDQLKNKGITKVVVPGMQVLSYRYHELISKSTKKNLEEAKKAYEENPNDSFLKGRYEYIKGFYDRTYKKQDKISYLKTEELYRVVEIVTEYDTSIQLLNDVMVQGDSMSVHI